MYKKLICLIAVVLCLGLTVTSSADLVALYEFDTDLSDTGGNPLGPFDATVSDGTPVVNADGKLVLVRSEQDVISCGTTVGSAPDLTFALWVNSNTDSEYMRPLGKNDGDNSTPGWNVMVRPSGENNSIRPQLEGHGGSLWGTSVPVENAYVVGQWVHWACTWDSATETLKVYVDGTLMATSVIAGADVANTADELYVGRSGWGNAEHFDGMVDELAIWDHALTDEDVLAVFTLGPLALDPRAARKPNPADKATDVPREVVLGWTPGENATAHDVYLGTVFDDVNDAVLADAVSAGQTDTTYDPPGRLDFGTTYFWRIDETIAPPDSTVVKGKTWSFTTEPIGYPIAAERITVTASSQAENQGPENTINGSGLDASDQHSTELTEMWLSAAAGPQPTWIQYEFDKVVKLHEMWVWNHNGTMEAMVGIGFKDVSIEYSVNGTDYTTLGTTHEFAQGTAAADYEHNTTVDFGGAAAKFIRLTANSNWVGFLPQYGLGEVRFFSMPVFATEPSPDSGATDVGVDVTLGFKAGRGAAEHDVYLSTDEQAVIDGNAPVTTVTENSYSTSLDVDSTYYWRVDEVNDAETPTTWQGEIWNFTTPEFLVVDDFELYNDLDPGDPESNRILNTWIDGLDYPAANGSIVGYDEAPFTEQSIVYGGNQSMPFRYDNRFSWSHDRFQISEADLPLSPAQDWTEHGVTVLVLYFHGDLSNDVEQMYVKVNGAKVVYDGDPLDIIKPRWKQWSIDLASFGVDLSDVTEISIGFEHIGPAPTSIGRVAVGGQGIVYFDEIRLYKSAPAVASEEIWIEAEAATTILEPLKTFDDAAASAGKYIGTVEGDGDPYQEPPDEATGPGLATYNFTVAGGTYKISLRVIIPPGNNNSFWVHVPDATYNQDVSDSGWIVMNNIPDSTEWYWKDVFSSDAGNQSVEFTLAPGSHTLLIGHREELALLDAIVITDLLD